MILVRVVAPHFVAGFETDGIVRRCAPILRKALMGKTDAQARAVIAARGWKASIMKDKLHGRESGKEALSPG